MQIIWDVNKAKSNLTKHKVAFIEAQTVFDDFLAAIFADVLHSDYEERSVIIGYSSQNRLLIVSFAEHELSIRIISARFATKQERIKHEQETGFGE